MIARLVSLVGEGAAGPAAGQVDAVPAGGVRLVRPHGIGACARPGPARCGHPDHCQYRFELWRIPALSCHDHGRHGLFALLDGQVQGAIVGRKVRRAAGTQSFTDLLRHPSRLIEQLTGDTRRRAEADVVAWSTGEAREVSAFVREDHRLRQGSLILDPAAASPVVWRPIRIFGGFTEDVALVAPFHVHGVGPVVGPGSTAVDKTVFRLLSVQAADRYWELAIPATDAALVRAALRGKGAGS